MSDEKKPQERQVNRNPDLLSHLYESSEVKGPLPQREHTFVMDSRMVVPELQEALGDQDFELTLRGLTARQELQVSKESGSSQAPSTMAFLMAKKSLVVMNGNPMKPVQRDWLWERLGFGGRAKVVSELDHVMGIIKDDGDDEDEVGNWGKSDADI